MSLANAIRLAFLNMKAKFGRNALVAFGSSIGISKAHDTDGLENSLSKAFDYADRVLVEPAIENLREINCSVLGDRHSARASVCEEPLNATDTEL